MRRLVVGGVMLQIGALIVGSPGSRRSARTMGDGGRGTGRSVGRRRFRVEGSGTGDVAR